MKFTLEITGMGNAAFQEDEDFGSSPELEVARILREAAKHIEDGHLGAGILWDISGNRVGEWVTEN